MPPSKGDLYGLKKKIATTIEFSKIQSCNLSITHLHFYELNIIDT